MKIIAFILTLSLIAFGLAQEGDLDKGLFEAIEAGDTESLRTILDQGASTNANNSLRFKPLHMAAIQNQPEVTQILLDYGADAFKEVTGLTPFHLAAKNNNVEVLKIYLNSGFPIDLQQKSSFEQTALGQAILSGSTDAFLFLLQQGADPNFQTFEGNTPLITSVERKQDVYVAHLVSVGADLSTINTYNLTALDIAQSLELVEIVDILENAVSN